METKLNRAEELIVLTPEEKELVDNLYAASLRFISQDGHLVPKAGMEDLDRLAAAVKAFKFNPLLMMMY